MIDTNCVLELTTCFVFTTLFVVWRVFLLNSTHAPNFSAADNPAASSPSCWTRTLTFFYLPAFHFYFLLLYPKTLSFDWSMDSIPLLHHSSDLRNLFSISFYSLFLIAFIRTCQRLLCFHFTRIDGQFDCFSLRSIKSTFASLSSTSISSTCSSTSSSRAESPIKPKHSLSPNSLISSSSSSSSSSFFIQNHSNTSRPSLPQVHLLVFALALLVLPFLLCTNLFFYVGFVAAERCLYIPSMGFSWLVAIGLHNLLYNRSLPAWADKSNKNLSIRFTLACNFKLLFQLLFACTLICLASRAHVRTLDWLTEEQLYRSGVSINPAKSYANLANVLASQSRLLEAEHTYRLALHHRSNMADVHYNLGILLQQQGRLSEAMQSYQQAIRYRPKLAAAHLNLGLTLVALDRKSDAEQVFATCGNLNDFNLKDPIAHRRHQTNALMQLGRLLSERNEHQAAIEVYRKAMQRSPVGFEMQSLLNVIGESYFQLGDFEQAEHWYRRSVQFKSTHVPAHLTLAKLYQRTGRPSLALESYHRALELDSNDPNVLLHYGQFLSDQQQHDQAVALYKKALQRWPNHFELTLNCAGSFRMAGQAEQAERMYRQAVRLNPNDQGALTNLGAMLHLNGKLDEAEQSYLAALQLRPQDAITSGNLAKLRNLKRSRSPIA